MTEAATGVKDANQRVAQISTVSQSVAKDIATVNQASGEIASGSEQVLTSSAELSKLAEELQRMVARFKISQDGDHSAADGTPWGANGPTRQNSPKGIALSVGRSKANAGHHHELAA